MFLSIKLIRVKITSGWWPLVLLNSSQIMLAKKCYTLALLLSAVTSMTKDDIWRHKELMILPTETFNHNKPNAVVQGHWNSGEFSQNVNSKTLSWPWKQLISLKRKKKQNPTMSCMMYHFLSMCLLMLQKW